MGVSALRHSDAGELLLATVATHSGPNFAATREPCTCRCCGMPRSFAILGFRRAVLQLAATTLVHGPLRAPLIARRTRFGEEFAVAAWMW